MPETEELGHNEVAELIAGAARWAASQPSALTPGQVRAQRPSVTAQRRWRPPSLRAGVFSLVAAALVVVAVSPASGVSRLFYFDAAISTSTLPFPFTSPKSTTPRPVTCG